MRRTRLPPFLGQGLNAGLRDAINLGWKLPLVMSGDCDIRLLRTYEEERAPHSLDLVEAAVRIGMLMETLAAREAGRSDPHADAPAPSGNLPAGRITPPLRAGLFCSEQLSHGSSAGDVFAQPRVRSADGQSVQLDELYGRGFLIVGRDEASLRVEAAGADLLEQLGASRLSIEGLELVEGSFDRLFEKHAAALVRPDRYIYGVVDADWSLDRLLGELRRQLGLRLAHE